MTDALSQPAGSPFGPDPGRAQANHLLAALPHAEAMALRPDLETVPLAVGQVLYEPWWSLGHVWFPLRGMASLLTPMPSPQAIHRVARRSERNAGRRRAPDEAIHPAGRNAEGRFIGQSEGFAQGGDGGVGRQGGARVEAVTIGPEGMVGLALALGVETAAETAVVRVPGEAARVSAEAFRRAVNDGPGLRRLLARYTLALIGQMAQLGACAWLHEVEQRLANRLVMSQDAVHGAATFPLTHEVAAEMLGVHRPTVSAAAAKLQRAGLIAYARGAVTVLDRPGLDAASCGCHRAVKARFDGLFGGPG